MAIGNSTLRDELRLFETNRHKWLLSHQDKFVVISGTTVAGFYPDFPSAYCAGLAKFGFRDFLVKQVCAEDPVYVIY